MASWRAFSSGLRELRIHFCNTAENSKGVRDFIQRQYPQLKKANPTLPILIREASDVEARMFARFEHGQEMKVPLAGLSESQVADRLRELEQRK